MPSYIGTQMTLKLTKSHLTLLQLLTVNKSYCIAATRVLSNKRRVYILNFNSQHFIF